MYESSPEIKFQRIEGTFGEAPESEGMGFDFGIVKSLLPKIIALIIIAGAAYFAYSYFIGNIKEVQFSVMNTENETLEDAGIRVYESSGNEPIAELSDGGAAKLRYGNYRYEAVAPEYKASSGSFEVSAESSGSIEIKLRKDMRVDLQIADFPGQLVQGQRNVEALVTLKNSAEMPADVELVLEGALKDLGAELSAESIRVPASGTNSSILSFDVPKDIAVKDAKKGDLKKGSIRVKYTNTKEEVSFTLFRKPELKVSPASINFGTLKAGVIGQGAAVKTIKITNSSPAFNVGEVKAQIEIVSTQYTANSEEEVLDWFLWSTEIDSIEAGKSASANLIVNVPVEALSDLISGNILLSTDYWDAEIPFELEVSGAEIALSISATNSGKVSLDMLDAGYYESKDVALTITNNSSVELELFTIVNPSDGCSVIWIARISKNTIASLAPKGGKDKTIITVSAPTNATVDEAQKCIIKIGYSTPTGERKSQDFELSITPQG
ncbi:MAG: hypothetical protein HYW05_03430 [Candidatus Diapherotrites archaeon]|nr:hypothetical protein [Candidatus Diapherotrites archaeon]